MEVKEIKTLSDHVHLLVCAPPRYSPSRIANILKSISTRLIFKTFPKIKKQHFWGGELWVGGYFVRSAGSGLTTEQIQKYILDQDKPVELN